MSKMRRILSGGEEGFTLIELLVVIAVLGILAAIAIPRLGGVTDKARLAEAVSFASSLRSAQEMFYVENDNTYATSTSGLYEYIDETSAPDDWTVTVDTSSATTEQGYIITITGTSGTVTATAISVDSSTN